MDTANALKRRIAAATPKDVILGMFLESTLSVVEKDFGRAAADQVRDQVIARRSVVNFFRYPVTDLLQVLDYIAQKAPNELGYNKAIENAGSAAVRYFFDSPIGKTMILLAGANPHPLIASAPAGYKACVSFGQRDYEKVADREALVTFKSELLGPAWQVGVFRQALKSACNVEAKSEVIDQDETAMTFKVRITW